MSWRAAGALAAGWLAIAPAAAAERSLQLGYGTLRYDDTAWRPRESAPPVAAALDCIAPECGSGASATIVFDPRAVLRPGAGAFTPGALGAASLAVRAQDLTPGGRLAQTAPLRPIAGGYGAEFEVQDETLGRSALAVIVSPLASGSLHWRLTAPHGDPALPRRLGQLFQGWKPRMLDPASRDDR